ncbi:outer membrane protein assembly factor BamD [Flavobacterium macacae]|uniref:Outer membrane protein assembly factor BamD n=1 Tax=Flavobacterium macacae TaxID=2488993 RepID=A0A3P3W6Y9_9FLAO|nr:outer membrane protein assembly factor BamD [Flavobacterium macacae]RRJ90198.1 outer membrane protein assembly factor BamD [Flavobacterium macacae]
MNKIFYILLIAVTLGSCSSYQKALKSEDVSVKYDVASKMYEAEKYTKAIRLFEQIAPTYRGKPAAEKMFYMFAQSYYKTKQYYSAGYQFESFASSYPKSEKVEEAAYLGAESYSNLSPRYSLDQVDTNKAIDKLQNFINNYPDSPYLSQANERVKVLREKLEKKAFEIAKQYNTIGGYTRDYSAAIKALDNFIADYPGTPFKEDALYYRFDSAYILALNSVENRKKERLDFAKGAYASLIKFNESTKYKSDVDKKLEAIEKELQQFSN